MSDGTIIVEHGPALEAATAQSIADTRESITKIQEQFGSDFPIYSEGALQLEQELSAVIVNFLNSNIASGTPADGRFVEFVVVNTAALSAAIGGFVESFKTTEEQKQKQRETLQSRLLAQLLEAGALPVQGQA